MTTTQPTSHLEPPAEAKAAAAHVPHRWRNLSTMLGITVIEGAEGGLTTSLFPAIAQALQPEHRPPGHHGRTGPDRRCPVRPPLGLGRQPHLPQDRPGHQHRARRPPRAHLGLLPGLRSAAGPADHPSRLRGRHPADLERRHRRLLPRQEPRTRRRLLLRTRRPPVAPSSDRSWASCPASPTAGGSDSGSSAASCCWPVSRSSSCSGSRASAAPRSSWPTSPTPTPRGSCGSPTAWRCSGSPRSPS